MTRLDGKVAVVTGGARGIGLATASRLVDAGARVVIAARSDDIVAQATAHFGSVALGVCADVRREHDVDRLFDQAVSAFGGVDILVNNAGIGIFKPVEKLSLSDWQEVIDTNLTGVFLCTRRVLALLRARGGGWVINISSLASTNPFIDGAAYCASKAGLNAFTEALMQEVRGDNIRVTNILPGSVRTDFMHRARPSGAESAADEAWKLDAEDVAQAVLDVIAHPARSLPSRLEIRPARPPKRS